MRKSLTALLMLCTFTAVGCSSVNEKDTIITETTQVMETEKSEQNMEETEAFTEAESFGVFQADSFTVYSCGVSSDGEDIYLYGVINKNENSVAEYDYFYDDTFLTCLETEDKIIGKLITDKEQVKLNTESIENLSTANISELNLLWEDGSTVEYTVKTKEEKAELLDYGIMPLGNENYCKFITGINLPSNKDDINLHIGFKLKFRMNSEMSLADHFNLAELEDVNIFTEDGTDIKTLFNAETVSFEDNGDIDINYGRGEYEGNVPSYDTVEELVRQCTKLRYTLDGIEYNIPIWNK